MGDARLPALQRPADLQNGLLLGGRRDGILSPCAWQTAGESRAEEAEEKWSQSWHHHIFGLSFDIGIWRQTCTNREFLTPSPANV